jgi:hypothetical protein
LRWEVEQVIKNVLPKHLLLIVPTTSIEYNSFKEDLGSLFLKSLPDYPLGARKEYYRAVIRGAIYFDDDWTPHFVRFDTLKAPGNYRRLVESHFVYGLRPVYDRFSVTWLGPWWRYPKARKVMAPIFLIAALLMLIGLVYAGWQLIGVLIQLFKLTAVHPNPN